MKKYKNQVKILAMHHHLVGIPDTGADRLTVIDAGDVLRTILRYRSRSCLMWTQTQTMDMEF